MSIPNITQEGLELVRSWLRARALAKRAQDEYFRCNTECADAEKALAKWMAPPVIKPKSGEKLAIWCGDSLIQLEVGGVTSKGDGDGPGHMTSDQVTVRFAGAKFAELEH